MKKGYIIIAAILMITVGLMGDTAINIRGGVLFPSGSETGFMPGLSYGVNVDNVVELSAGFDFFYRTYEDTETVDLSETGTGSTLESVQASTDFKTFYVPIMATIKVAVPVELPVTPYGGVGLGWGLLYEDIFIAGGKTEDGKEYDPVDEKDLYNGFNWALQLGAKYELSPNVHLYGETFYNFGKMKKDVEKTKFGRTWDEVDMSGLGLRLGIEMRLK